MRFFGKDEVAIIFSILAVLSLLTFLNLKVALRRSRDFQRKEDVKNIENAMNAFKQDHGYFPPATSDGRLLACPKEGLQETRSKITDIRELYKPCAWGWDSVEPYLTTVPADPHTTSGRVYLYYSTGSNFQIFASLEGVDEEEFNAKVEARNLKCGQFICNFGRSSGVPLDKSLEEYENELRRVRV